MLDWQLLTPETKFGLLADKMGGMTFWKQISQAFPSLSLFSSFFFFFFFSLSSFAPHSAIRYPNAWNMLGYLKIVYNYYAMPGL